MNVEEIAELEAELNLNTIRPCVHPGCGTHRLGEMSQCIACDAYMCVKHVCACPIPGIEEMDAA
jgi:hypothetical protein